MSKKLTLTFLCLIVSYFSFCQAHISGPTAVDPGTTTTYSVEFDQPLNPYTNVTWNVTGGTIIEQTINPTMPLTCTVQWDEGDGTGNISIYEDVGTQGEEMIVFRGTSTQSELCNGFLGTPAIAVDFGQGNNPGPAFQNGITTYSFNSACAISSGQYTIRNNTLACRGLWHQITEDHTPGDVNGYFMMVDGDDRRGEFYRSTVSGLTPGTKYEFSVWAGNLVNTSGLENPKINFEIYANGVLLGSSGNTEIPFSATFKWNKIGFVFSIPSGVSSIQIVIVNANRKEGGNDLVLDDISFAPCYPPVTASFANGTLVDKQHTCLNGTVSLFSYWPTTIPFTNPGYRWERSTDLGISWSTIPGATSVNYSPQTEDIPGEYKYRVISFEMSNPSQSYTSNEITFYVQRMRVDSKTYELFSCSNSTNVLDPSFFLEFGQSSTPLTYTYTWSPGTYLNNPNIKNPTISLPQPPPPNSSGAPVPPTTYYYTLTVNNTNYNCAASATQTVILRNPRQVFVPNAFSPNGDGSNDYFRPINLEDYPNSKFTVYNRWGQVVFYSTGPDYRWDGKLNGVLQASGVFTWLVQMTNCTNNISPGNSGTVTLIR